MAAGVEAKLGLRGKGRKAAGSQAIELPLTVRGMAPEALDAVDAGAVLDEAGPGRGIRRCGHGGRSRPRPTRHGCETRRWCSRRRGRHGPRRWPGALPGSDFSRLGTARVRPARGGRRPQPSRPRRDPGGHAGGPARHRARRVRPGLRRGNRPPRERPCAPAPAGKVPVWCRGAARPARRPCRRLGRRRCCARRGADDRGTFAPRVSPRGISEGIPERDYGVSGSSGHLEARSGVLDSGKSPAEGSSATRRIGKTLRWRIVPTTAPHGDGGR